MCTGERPDMCLAIPGKIISIKGDDALARSGAVSFGGVVKEINLALVPHAGIGDYVLVHAGFAINTINESEADRIFEYLEEIEKAGIPEDEDS
jgi:hydrogenase expression/formation protein HypC